MTMKRLHVFPGEIDSDFQGEIKIMAPTLSTIVTLTHKMLGSCLLANSRQPL
jgi:dUTPase